MTRLSKEGSSADEPMKYLKQTCFNYGFETNFIFSIPLSDYSSDEGDSSSSSDDEGKDSLCDLEGPCCQMIRVPPSSPVLFKELKVGYKNCSIAQNS